MAHIVLVEDNELVAKSLRRIFERRGHHVTVCNTLEQARHSLVDGQVVDVWLTDRQVGLENGWEFAWTASELCAARIVLMSGALWDDASPERYWRKGHDNLDRLVAMVEG